MPLKSMQSRASRSSSRCRPNSFPKMKPLSENPHYLVIDTTLPSHIFNDCSLFTTYVPLHRLHRTVFGTDIVIEGIGNVHVHVVMPMSGKSIFFRFHDSWHVPSSPHHFLSASSVISLGNQIMIKGRSPQMIFSHQKCLVNPNLSKYMPFTCINGLIALEFNIPVLSPQPASTTTRSTIAQPVLSLQASKSTYHPFAGLSITQSLFTSSSSGSLQVVESALVDRVPYVALHGGAQGADALVAMDLDVCVVLNNNKIITLQNGGEPPLPLSTTYNPTSALSWSPCQNSPMP